MTDLIKRTEDLAAVDRRWSNFDRMFDELWRMPISRLFRIPSLEMADAEWLHWHPAADIEETDDAYILRMDLPGVNKKDVSVTIQNNVLSVRGERKRDEADKTYHVTERFTGNFYRSFVLPSTVDENSIVAEYKDGVLTATIRKKEEAKPKAIEIR